MKIPLIILTVLIFLDGITTAMVLAKGGYEANPIMRFLLRHAKWPWLMLFSVEGAYVALLWEVRPPAFVVVILIGVFGHVVVLNFLNWRAK